MTQQAVYNIFTAVESKRPQTILRFRTKKQKKEWERTAKNLKFSLNEYILRVMEEKHDIPKPAPVQQEAISI